MRREQIISDHFGNPILTPKEQNSFPKLITLSFMYFLESLAETLLSVLQQRLYFIFPNNFKDSKELKGSKKGISSFP